MFVCSSEQQGAHVEHYDLTDTSTLNTDAHEHRLPALHASSLPICRHRRTRKPELLYDNFILTIIIAPVGGSRVYTRV